MCRILTLLTLVTLLTLATSSQYPVFTTFAAFTINISQQHQQYYPQKRVTIHNYNSTTQKHLQFKGRYLGFLGNNAIKVLLFCTLNRKKCSKSRENTFKQGFDPWEIILGEAIGYPYLRFSEVCQGEYPQINFFPQKSDPNFFPQKSDFSNPNFYFFQQKSVTFQRKTTNSSYIALKMN